MVHIMYIIIIFIIIIMFLFLNHYSFLPWNFSSSPPDWIKLDGKNWKMHTVACATKFRVTCMFCRIAHQFRHYSAINLDMITFYNCLQIGFILRKQTSTSLFGSLYDSSLDPIECVVSSWSYIVGWFKNCSFRTDNLSRNKFSEIMIIQN